MNSQKLLNSAAKVLSICVSNHVVPVPVFLFCNSVSASALVTRILSASTSYHWEVSRSLRPLIGFHCFLGIAPISDLIISFLNSTIV
jgi:hypothetical protein